MRRDSEEDPLPPNKIQKNRFLAKAAVNSPGLERHSRRRNTAEIKHHLFRQPEISESAGENTPGCKMCYASLTAAAARRDGKNGGGRRVLAHSTHDGICAGIRKKTRCRQTKYKKNRFLAKAAVNSPGLERHSRRRNTAEIKHHLFRQPEISESAGENTPGCKMCYASLTAAAARRDGANGGGRRVLAHSTDDGMCTGIRKKTGCRRTKNKKTAFLRKRL